MSPDGSTGYAPGDLNIFPDGFVVLPFPSSIQQEVRRYIAGFIASKGGIDYPENADDIQLLEILTRIVSSFSDEEFVDTFRKGYRTLPGNISKGFVPWIESELAERLKTNRISLTYVCEADRRTNPSLGPESYDIYWRIVRPNKPDVAGPHIDSTFADLNVGSDRVNPLPFEYTARWRVWVPILGCDPDNSLQFIPGSQFEDFPATSVDTPLGPRPSVSDDWKRDNMHRFVCPFTKTDGYCVLFPDNVIHQGPVNKGDGLRLSMDFTVVMT